MIPAPFKSKSSLLRLLVPVGPYEVKFEKVLQYAMAQNKHSHSKMEGWEGSQERHSQSKTEH